MPQLEHLFAAGIRFDAGVQYLAEDAHGIRYQRLPILKSPSPVSCTLTSVMQCVAILGQIPRKRILARPRRAAERALRTLDEGDVVACASALHGAVVAQLHPSNGVEEIGIGAWSALRAGHQCMLQFESARSSRWATVIGVELERSTAQVRALLLLDSSASEPWACAHNVRIELHSLASGGTGAKAKDLLSCRHLTGEVDAVRLRRLLILMRSEPGRAASAATAS